MRCASVAQPEQSASLRSSRALVRVQPGALVGDLTGRSFHTRLWWNGRHAALRTPCLGVPVQVRAGAFCTHARRCIFTKRRWTMNEPVIFGTHDDKTLAQLRDVASRAE